MSVESLRDFRDTGMSLALTVTSKKKGKKMKLKDFADRANQYMQFKIRAQFNGTTWECTTMPAFIPSDMKDRDVVDWEIDPYVKNVIAVTVR